MPTLNYLPVKFCTGHGSLLEYESVEPEDRLSPPETDYGLILRSCVSGAQSERVNALIQKVIPETVVFVAVMKNCDVQSPRPLLIISKERTLVEAAQFPHENGMPVTLQIPDKSEKWHPRFYMEKGEGMLAGDWLGFVCDNNVQVGDMCIFVPSTGSEGSMFTVHILAKATHPWGVTNIRSRHGTKDAMTGLAVNTVEPSHGGNVSPKSNIHGFPHDSLDGKDTRPSEQPSFILPWRTSLTTTQRKIVDEKWQAIGSKYPLYVATLNSSSLQKKQFEFGKDYAHAVRLPAKNTKVKLKSKGKDWPTEMSCRRSKNSYRWMLVSGWGEFVCGKEWREGGLLEGDMLLFELKSMNEEMITMKIDVVPGENSQFLLSHTE